MINISVSVQGSFFLLAFPQVGQFGILNNFSWKPGFYATTMYSTELISI